MNNQMQMPEDGDVLGWANFVLWYRTLADQNFSMRIYWSAWKAAWVASRSNTLLNMRESGVAK